MYVSQCFLLSTITCPYRAVTAKKPMRPQTQEVTPPLGVLVSELSLTLANVSSHECNWCHESTQPCIQFSPQLPFKILQLKVPQWPKSYLTLQTRSVMTLSFMIFFIHECFLEPSTAIYVWCHHNVNSMGRAGTRWWGQWKKNCCAYSMAGTTRKLENILLYLQAILIELRHPLCLWYLVLFLNLWQ